MLMLVLCIQIALLRCGCKMGHPRRSKASDALQALGVQSKIGYMMMLQLQYVCLMLQLYM